MLPGDASPCVRETWHCLRAPQGGRRPAHTPLWMARPCPSSEEGLEGRRGSVTLSVLPRFLQVMEPSFRTKWVWFQCQRLRFVLLQSKQNKAKQILFLKIHVSLKSSEEYSLSIP